MGSSRSETAAPLSVRELFDACLALTPEARQGLLDERCAGRDAARAEVERLLALEARATAFMSVPLCTLPPFVPPGKKRRLPRRLGPYRVVRVLGAGGMGMVVEAVHRDSGRRVALKHLVGSEAAHAAGLRREIRALARLRHPGIARILDEGVDGDEPWYAMELIDGVPLDRMLVPRERSRAERDRLLTIAARMCSPLSYLHGEGIVHRDLKPSNVMVRDDGMPVLVDFGLTVSFGGGVARDTVLPQEGGVGTAAYMAPEQAAGQLVDARADLYALGAILYELLTGQPPGGATTSGSPGDRRSVGAPPPPSALEPTIPPSLDSLVLGLLQVDPRDRPGHADVVARSLRRLGIDATPPVDVPPVRAYLYRPSLEGRAEVMERLERALCGRGAGGALIVLEGESGVGKTRVALEAASVAYRRGHVVLSGECLHHGAAGPPPLEAFARPLQSIADLCRDDAAAGEALLATQAGRVLAPLAPVLGKFPGTARQPEPPPLPPDAARRRVLSSLVDLCAKLAARRPVLLVLDDLQWADDLTLGFLALAARTSLCRDVPIVVLGTRRSEEGSSELLRIQRIEGVETLALGRLTRDSIASMAAGMLGTAEAPGPLAASVAELSEGNPFFAAEYLRAAVAHGYLQRDTRGRWQSAGPARAGGVAGLGLPSSLYELVSERLGGLSAAATHVVEQAAVLGRNVDSAVLAAACRETQPPHLEAVDELLARQILVPREGDLRFVHDKIREIAYERIDPAERIDRHRAAAEALERVSGGEARLGEIGSHWQQAGELARARACYLPAARGAVARLAHGEAEGLYRAYLDIAVDDDVDCLAARTELAERVIRALGRNEEAVVELERALTQARRLGDGARTATLLAILGACHRDMGRGGLARAMYAEAIAIGRKRKDDAFLARALRLLGIAEYDAGRIVAARASLDEALRLAIACDAVVHRALALECLGTIEFDLGRRSQARQLWNEALGWLLESGNEYAAASPRICLGMLEVVEGRYGEAEKLYRQTIELHRKFGTRLPEGRVRALLASLLWILGRSEAGPMYEAALAIHREVHDRMAESETLGNYAHYLAHEGQLEAAERSCRASVALCRLIASRQSEGAVLTILGTILGQQGRAAEARRAFRAAFQRIESDGNPSMEAEALHELARVERRARGSLGEVQRLLSRCRRILEASSPSPALVCCLTEAGHLRLARGRSPRRELERARAVAWKLGLGPATPAGMRVARLEHAAAAAHQDLERGELRDDVPTRPRQRRAS